MSHIDNIEKNIGSLNGKKILDVGAGRGEFLIDCGLRGYDAVGIEINPEKISIGHEKAEKQQLKIIVIQGSADQLPFADNTFDFINVAEVIEHVREPEPVLREIYRVLKKDGKAYMSVHNRFGMRDTHFRVYFLGWMPRWCAYWYLTVRGKHKDYSGVDLQDIQTMHYFTFSGFKEIVTRLGFLCEDIRKSKMKRLYKGLAYVVRLPVYALARAVYFSTFHIILTKI